MFKQYLNIKIFKSKEKYDHEPKAIQEANEAQKTKIVLLERSYIDKGVKLLLKKENVA